MVRNSNTLSPCCSIEAFCLDLRNTDNVWTRRRTGWYCENSEFFGVDCSVSCGMKDRLTAIRGMCERILEAQSTVIEIVLIQKSTIAFAVAKSDWNYKIRCCTGDAHGVLERVSTILPGVQLRDEYLKSNSSKQRRFRVFLRLLSKMRTTL